MSTNTAPGMWPASKAARPERPSRYHRTSATTTSSRWAASHSLVTRGSGNRAIDGHVTDAMAPVPPTAILV